MLVPAECSWMFTELVIYLIFMKKKSHVCPVKIFGENEKFQKIV